jgi:hypothetical protein
MHRTVADSARNARGPDRFALRRPGARVLGFQRWLPFRRFCARAIPPLRTRLDPNQRAGSTRDEARFARPSVRRGSPRCWKWRSDSKKAPVRTKIASGGGKAISSREQVLAYCKEVGLPETILNYMPPVSADELLRLDDGPPSSATDFLDAIIAAARRQGSNGRGKDGVEGYIRMLARIGCRTFDRWVIRAMVEQVEDRSRPHRVSPEEMEELEQFGMDAAAVLQKAYEEKYGSGHDELWPDEIEDPWGLNKGQPESHGIEQRPMGTDRS